MLRQVHHTSVTVSDMDRSLAFYRDLLGMEVISELDRSGGYASTVTGIPEAHLRIVYVEGGNHKIELIEYLNPKGRPVDMSTANPGIAHLAFEVDDLEGMYEELSAAGVTFRSEPVEVPGGGPNAGTRIVYVRDPDNFTIELIQRPEA
jgi:lactoylglutathione lyase